MGLSCNCSLEPIKWLKSTWTQELNPKFGLEQGFRHGASISQTLNMTAMIRWYRCLGLKFPQLCFPLVKPCLTSLLLSSGVRMPFSAEAACRCKGHCVRLVKELCLDWEWFTGETRGRQSGKVWPLQTWNLTAENSQKWMQDIQSCD